MGVINYYTLLGELICQFIPGNSSVAWHPVHLYGLT
jgi:hypothetical protein